ncbi:MAG: nucleoside hydrolase [Erysipelotrichia bacterium]|nr:nucleoside hydrolase [Erysipelotrichia bacterium]
MTDKRKVIFDTDIGDDDAVALAACLLSEKVEIIGITTVHGNLPIECASDNALRMVDFFKKDIKVYQGCSQPLVRHLNKGRKQTTLMQTVNTVVDGKLIRIHAETLPLPEATSKLEKNHAVSFIVDTLRSTTEKIDICAIGPLTNIGAALILDKDIIKNIGNIYIMGGGLYKGNRTPIAEANFYDDPEAAEIVLNCGANVFVCPLEACELGATYTREDLDTIKALNNPAADLVYNVLDGYINRGIILFGGKQECCVYDYAAVAPLLDENVNTEVRKDVAHVDFSGGMADGQLVIDRRNFGLWTENANIIYQQDGKRVHNLLINLLKKFK